MQIPADNVHAKRIRGLADVITSRSNLSPRDNMVICADDMRAIIWAACLIDDANVKYGIEPKPEV